MIPFLNYIWMRYRIGVFWQNRASEYYNDLAPYRPANWDCDQRITEMKKELESYGFRVGYDFVYDRGTINGINHVRMSICGVMADPATDNEEFGYRRQFLGAYIKPTAKDKAIFMETAKRMFKTVKERN